MRVTPVCLELEPSCPWWYSGRRIVHWHFPCPHRQRRLFCLWWFECLNHLKRNYFKNLNNSNKTHPDPMTRPTSSDVSSEIDFSIVSRSRNNSLINDCAWSRLFIVGPRITHTRVELSESLGSDLIDIHTLHTSYKNGHNFTSIESSTRFIKL